jgi:ribonucleoside-diphosphate reductase alpha chain
LTKPYTEIKAHTETKSNVGEEVPLVRIPIVSMPSIDIRNRITAIVGDRADALVPAVPEPSLNEPRRTGDAEGQLLLEAVVMQQFNAQFEHFQDDAPACDICGSITVRNGTCYKCFNCGNSMGCS